MGGVEMRCNVRGGQKRVLGPLALELQSGCELPSVSD